MAKEKQVSQELANYLAVLEAAICSERGKAILAFARNKMGFETGVVRTTLKLEVPAPLYCQHLLANALILGEDDRQMTESYEVVALMLTMARMRKSYWSFGAEVYYQLKSAGIAMTRIEVLAFRAQFGSYQTSREKGAMLDRSLIANAFYGSELATNVMTALGNGVLPEKEIPQELMQQYIACWSETSPAESLENLLNAFVPAYIGQTNSNLLAGFIDWLRSQGFYTAPASTKYHSNYSGGLLVHTCRVIARHVAIEKPQTASELGKIILADTCHDLCKFDAYEPYWKNQKVPGPAAEGGKTLYENDGKAYHWESVLSFGYNAEQIPLGHGFKSLYLASSFFGPYLGEDVAAAIDCHMHDEGENPNIAEAMASYPLAMYLHIADSFATHLDEVN